MKKIGFLTIGLLLLSGCADKVQNKYNRYEPVYTDYATFRTPPVFESPRNIDNTSQIYINGDYFFIVETDKGIHFIDNSNSSSPSNIGFLEVDGCTGLSIRGSSMYVNSFIDLIVLDITTIHHPVEIARIQDAFPMAVPTMEKSYPVATIDKNEGVVTSWKIKQVKEKADDYTMWWNNCWNCGFESTDPLVTFDANSGSASAPTGTAGSITKFSILNDYLYVMDGFSLKPFDIANATSPVEKTEVGIWGNVETLFPYENYLFMGTPSGMLVYSVVNPEYPTYVSQISHARGCDPVVVQDDFAYVTVRSGGPCGGSVNQLDVIDVSDMSSPILVAEFEMKNPHGLGISGNRLFVCDGNAGLKVFDAANPVNCGNNLLETFNNVKAIDVIPLNGLLMMIGEDGIYQYDYSNESDVQLISTFNF